MRFRCLFICSLLICNTPYAQVTNPATDQRGPAGPGIFAPDIAGKPLSEKKLEDIDGFPFLFEGWSTGSVLFRNGKKAGNLLLKFSIYDNRLFFQKDGNAMEFVEPVHEFNLDYSKDGNNRVSHWRNGFPAIDGYNEETFYEVIVDGAFQLLFMKRKMIQSYRPYNQAERRRFEEKKQLYALVPGGRMFRVKKSREALAKEMPEYAGQILEISGQHKWKMKEDDDIVLLFAALNAVTTSK